jgi:hypothetical protein
MQKVTIVPENALRSSDMLSRKQRIAVEAADRETAAVEAHPDVAAAREAADAAERELTALEQRVIDGDKKVTATDTGQAREEARFAQLRLSAARKSVRDQRDQDRQKTYDNAIQQARDVLNDTPALDALRDQAIDAMTAYLAAIAKHNEAYTRAFNTMRQAGVKRYSADFQARADNEAHAILAAGGIVVDGQEHDRLQPAKLADYVVYKAGRATGSKGPRGILRVLDHTGIVPNGWDAA